MANTDISVPPTYKFVDITSNHSGSSVWSHFLKEVNGTFAKCKTCGKVLKHCGATSSLHAHLKAKHGTVLEKISNRVVDKGASSSIVIKQSSITNYFKQVDNSVAKVVARMAAKDGIPFSTFCTSKDIRAGILARKLEGDLLTSSNGIKNMVMKFGSDLKEHFKQKIQMMRKDGEKFCVSFDEWTSRRRQRYMNLTLVYSGHRLVNLGLVRLLGSMTAKRILQTVELKLNNFHLNLHDDIISMLTDGTAVMTCAGRLSPAHQQLCFAPGIQLGILDIIYPKKNKRTPETVPDSDEEEIAESEPQEEDGDDDDYSAGFQIEIELESEEEEMSEGGISHEHFKDLVSKARAVIKIFIASPLKNEVLQKHVKSDFHSELELILDNKTRWSSLHAMLERFCKLRNCIQKALIDLNSDIKLEDWEYDRLDDLVDALQPLKVTVEALCRRDTDLLQANASLNFALQKLYSANTPISLELHEALERRIKERRTDFSDVLQYLHTGLLDNDTLDGTVFTTPSRKKIAEILEALLRRLNAEITEITVDVDGVEVGSSEPARKKRKSNLQEELEVVLDQVKDNDSAKKSSVQKRNLLATIKQEMKMFESNNSRGYHLQLSYKYLKTILPTSVESERAFSASGYFCNRIRSQLADNTLDMLCFLRSYFQLSES